MNYIRPPLLYRSHVASLGPKSTFVKTIGRVKAYIGAYMKSGVRDEEWFVSNINSRQLLKIFERQVTLEAYSSITTKGERIMEKHEFVSIKKLSEILSVSVSLLYKKSEDRLIPHYRIGSRLLFNPAEVLAAMKCDVELPEAEQLVKHSSESSQDP